MYIFTILAIIASTLLMMASGGGFTFSLFNHFIDFYSLIILLVISVPILISSNLLRDFNNAFRIAFGKKNQETLIQIRRSLEAAELMRKTLLFGSGFMFLVTCLITLHTLDDPAYFGPQVATSLLSCLYGVAANILLLPLSSKLKIKMIEFMQE